MKPPNHFLQHAIVFLLFFVGAVFAQTEKPTIKPDAYEPNDKIAHATPIEFGKTIELNMHTAGDTDMLTFEVKQRGLVTWKIENWTGKNGRPHLYFCNSQGAKLNTSDVHHLYVTTPGVYGIVLISHQYSWERKAVKKPFQVTLNFQQLDDVTEPNDSFDTATPIKLGEPVTLRFLTSDDPDYLQFEAPGPGVAQLKIEDWDMNGRKSWPAKIWYDATGKKLTQQQYDHRVTKGTHFLKLMSSWYSWEYKAQHKPFKVTVTYFPQLDASEPNNTIETAREIQIGQPIAMRLRPHGDVDVVKLKLPASGLVECVTTNWDTTATRKPNPTFIYYDANGKKLAENRSKALLGPGVNYIRVSSAWYDWEVRSISNPFEVTFNWTPEGDAYEPNDKYETATVAEFDRDYQINIAPEYDLDMFRFEVDKPTRIKMVFEDYNPPKGMPPHPSVSYYNAEKYGIQMDDKGTVLLPKGISYAEVSSHHYSWERKQMIGKFKVQFKTNVQAGAMPEDWQPSDTNANTSQNSQPTTDKPNSSRRKAKRGLWIFEVEKVQ